MDAYSGTNVPPPISKSCVARTCIQRLPQEEQDQSEEHYLVQGTEERSIYEQTKLPACVPYGSIAVGWEYSSPIRFLGDIRLHRKTFLLPARTRPRLSVFHPRRSFS